MAERKWGAISSGATFEALATTIVFFEDPKATLFGRRGKDGGQDARSGDLTRVFQAKHHEDGSSAATIRDAKKEAAKIQNYRQPSHARYDQWIGVTHWRLITNAAFNPTDKQTWDTEVVPLFSAQGLVADYWERENLNGLLDKHPELHRSFFENETRAFLSVPELRERLPAQEPFLRRNELGSFCGRVDELKAVRDFLASSQPFLVVHGAGGMGKTRLLVEAGEAIASENTWQVLWANIASMTASAAWFDSVVPERPTLLLLDEPSDDEVLKQLSEQLGGRLSRTAQWKVAVAVRSPKDPVLRFLFSSRMRPRVRELPIGALLQVDAEAMCRDILGNGKLAALPEDRRHDAAREITRRFARHPVWLTLAIQLLEDRGDLTKVPETAKDLANEYLAEIECSQRDSPPEQVRNLLRWVALLGPINREDDSTIALLGEQAAAGGLSEVRRKLASLISNRSLIERGARNRFVELKPDVLRDHVLLSWLSVDVGFGHQPIVASDDAKALLETALGPVVSGNLSNLGRSILVSLSRTELLLRLSGHSVPLLADFFDKLRAATPGMSASQRLAMTRVLESVALVHPTATAAVVKVMRTSTAADVRVDGIFGERVIRQSDVLLALAWPLFHAAMGAQDGTACEAVLRELCALTEAEAELAPQLERGLPHDGKRAAALVERVLEGGQHFWGDFDEAARKLAEELLTMLSSQPPTNGKLALLQALVQPTIAVRRSQTWNDEQAVRIQQFAIGPKHPGWSTRSTLLARIKELLSADATPVESRVALWPLFCEAHRDLNVVCKRDKADDPYYQFLLDDLVWAREFLLHRKVTFEELSRARELWDWHHRFETDLRLKAVSEQLEEVYATNNLASEFEPLLNHDESSQREQRIAAKAAEIASVEKADGIAAFVEKAIAFLGAEHRLYQLMQVAWYLGERWPEQDVVRKFVYHSLQQATVGPRSDFGVMTAVGWAAFVRKGNHPERTASLVAELMAACGSDEQRANLLLQIYGRIPKLHWVGKFTVEEHTLLRGQSKLFVDTGRSAPYIGAVALTLEHDWPSLRVMLERLLPSLPIETRSSALRSLIDGLAWAVRDGDPSSLPAGLSEWLLNQLLTIPDFDDLDGNVVWQLDGFFKRVGRVQIVWLPQALAVRKELESRKSGPIKFRAVSDHSRFSKHLRPIAASDVEDAAVRQAVGRLLDFAEDNGSVGYYLPEVLRDVDPDGLVVPEEVCARLMAVSDLEQVRRFARIAGVHAVGSPAWRHIAKAAIAAIRLLDEDAARVIFSVIGERGVRSWSGEHGQVPAIFLSAVNDARAALEAESDPVLRPFWVWRLATAEAELRDEIERAKENRGE